MLMERSEDRTDDLDGDDGSRSSPDGQSDSPEMDRNPSPPPDRDEAEAVEEADAIGETVYSKHWLFSTLTRLIQVVTEQGSEDDQAQMELQEEEEDELCKVWDMAMDKDVAGFLQEFKAPDILLGVIAKSRCPRLTEICVGILGNMACFPDTCLSLSQNTDLGAVLLLLLGDTDPPTLLETCRLLLTCVSQPDVAPLWLDRVRKQASVCLNLCFIMSSSTNVDLLVKVGELVDKLFDEDEELMKSWVCARPSEGEHDDEDKPQGVAISLLEAAKQLRSESAEVLEVYLHALQLLTTVDECLQTLVCVDGPGEAVWAFVCEVVCEDLCQQDDPPLILQEQKLLLAPALSLLTALHTCRSHNTDISLQLVGSVLRVLQYHRECQQSRRERPTGSVDGRREGEGDEEEEEEKGEGDVQLQALIESTAEFLANILTDMPKGVVSELVKKDHLTETNCVTAVRTLLPQYSTVVQHLVAVLSEVEPKLADIVRREFPVAMVPS